MAPRPYPARSTAAAGALGGRRRDSLVNDSQANALERQNRALVRLERGVWKLRGEEARIELELAETLVSLFETRAHNAILALQLRLMNRRIEILERRKARRYRKALRRWRPGEAH